MNKSARKSAKSVLKHQQPGAALAVMLLAVPFVYLAAMGPYMYFGEFYYGSRGRVPPLLGQAVFGLVLETANYVADVVPRYCDCLSWFQVVATEDSIGYGDIERATRGEGDNEVDECLQSFLL